MQKLKLDVETLQVDSFRTGGHLGTGTVHAHSYNTYWCTAPMSADNKCKTPSWTAVGTGC